ncbi:AtpZ/AtpI family protein [bacterium]|nr:AtpZ/AtpI family protein [bacterium]
MEPKRDKQEPDAYAKAGLAMMIPMLMAAGPIAGLLVGWALQRWLGWGKWILWVMLVLGLIAGARETINVIKRLS